MRRSVVAGGLAAVVAMSTGAGWLAATRVKSPAKIAAEAAPPEASLITYGVEKRVLSSDLIVRGTMRYSDPISVVLAPSILRPAPVLVSEPPRKGKTVAEGDVALVVSGRPVFAIAGATPGYRDLGPGTVGADVRQLEEFLKRSGFEPGPIDGVLDSKTSLSIARWYTKAGYEAFGPNDQQRATLRLAQSALSQATDRLLQAKQTELTNRTGAKAADIIDAKSAIETARAAVVAAKNTAARNSSRGLADLALKQAEVKSKQADIVAKAAAVDAATIALDDAKRRDALATAGANPATGVVVTSQQLAVLQETLDEAKAGVTSAEADLTASETIATTVRSTGEAAIADARTKLNSASVFVIDGLSAQEVLNAYAAVRSAQAALTLAEATAAKDNSVAAADVTTKKALLNAARSRVVQAQLRIDSARGGYDPATGIQIVTSNDKANTQLALKQAEVALRQAQTAIPPAEAVLSAATGDLDAVRRVSELTKTADVQSIADANLRMTSSQARLRALSLPGVGAKTLAQSVAVAEAEVARLTAELDKTSSAIGVQVPANELVFFPSLPLRIDDTKVKRGDPASAEVMTVSGTRFAVDSALLTTEAPLTKLGAAATIEAPEYGYSSKGSITFLADKPGLRGTDAQHIAIEVTPEDNSTLLVGASVRITIPTRTTNGAALIVPVSALSVRADGSTQLQVETTPGTTRTVIVTAGLSAQGFVEIVPVKGTVSEGDRVVVGTEGLSSATDSSPGSSTATSVEPAPIDSIPATGETPSSTVSAG